MRFLLQVAIVQNVAYFRAQAKFFIGFYQLSTVAYFFAVISIY